jgi:hypothetical protein
VRLHHATTTDVADALMRDGFDARQSHWGTEEVSDYYAETVDDENPEDEPSKRSAVISVLLSDLDPALLGVDQPAVDEPICSAIGMKESEVHEAWALCDGTWQDSLEIAGSVVYRGSISPSLLTRES